MARDFDGGGVRPFRMRLKMHGCNVACIIPPGLGCDEFVQLLIDCRAAKNNQLAFELFCDRAISSGWGVSVELDGVPAFTFHKWSDVPWMATISGQGSSRR